MVTARPLAAALLAAALLLGSTGCSESTDAGSSDQGRSTALDGAWLTPGAGLFVQAGDDLAVTTVPSPEDAASLDVMAVDEAGEVAWRSTLPALPADQSVATHETHLPQLHATGRTVVLQYHVEQDGAPGSFGRSSALTAFDTTTGKHLWTQRERATRVVALTEEHLLAGDLAHEHLFVVLDPRTGRNLGRPVGEPDALGNSVEAVGNVAFLEDHEESGVYVTAVDLDSGRTRWRTQTAPGTTVGLPPSTVAAVTEDRVLLRVHGTDGTSLRVDLRDPSTGRLLARTRTDPSSTASFDPSSGVVVLHGGNVDPLEPSPLDGMSAVDMSTGKVLWSVPAQEAQREMLMVAGVGAGHLWVERDGVTRVGDIREVPSSYAKAKGRAPTQELLFGRIHSTLGSPVETVPDLE